LIDKILLVFSSKITKRILENSCIASKFYV